MKIYLFIIGFLVSTLSAEMFDDSEVSYSYDIEMNDDESIFRYLVDSTYYDQFSAEVLGVYIIYDDMPMKIVKDLDKMARILDRYLNLKLNKGDRDNSNNVKNDALAKVLNINLSEKFSKKYMDNNNEIRDIQFRLNGSSKELSGKNIKQIHNSISDYLKRRRDFYIRQNNYDGIAFCNQIEKSILIPLERIAAKLVPKVGVRSNYKTIAIKGLNKKELKLVWDEFKENNLGLIQAYFDANKDKLRVLGDNNTFEIELNDVEWNGMPKFYICLNIFGQKWHLRVDDYYVSGLHKVNLIKL
jgi:hypothetical protein